MCRFFFLSTVIYIYHSPSFFLLLYPSLFFFRFASVSGSITLTQYSERR